MASRLAGILNSASQEVLVAVPANDSRIDGYVVASRVSGAAAALRVTGVQVLYITGAHNRLGR